MSNNIELLSKTENFTIGTNNNLSEILANVVKVGTDTSNVTISIPQDISSSYNLILPVRQGASGESLVYGADGQLKWHDTTVLKQVISVYGSALTGNVVSTGTHDSPTYLDAYTANIVPMADNSKIFVQFKVNYLASLSASNQISFFIKKTDENGNTLATFTESLFGPYNAAGGFTGQYISNLVDEALTSNSISYQLGYQINGNVYATDSLGILGYESLYNNTIVLQEFEGSGSNATSVWNKGADSNGLYYNDGTVHIGSTKNALGSQNTPGVALELSGNLIGTNATFSGNIYAHAFIVEEAHIGPNTLFINGTRVLNQNDNGSVNVYTDKIISDASNGLTIQANGNNGNIILDPSGTGTIQLNGDVELSGGNLNAETFIGDLSGNVNAVTMTATTTTTNNLSLDGTLTTSNSTRVVGNLIPSVDDTYSLGAHDRVWKDVYIGPGSLYLNGTKILDDSSESINMRTDTNQALNIQTSGTGTLTLHSSGTGALNIEGGGPLTINSSGNSALELNSGTGGIDFNTSNTGSINFNTSNSGTINFNSDIVLQGNISMIQTGTSNPINLNDDVHVSGNLDVNDNLDVGGNLKVNRIDREDIYYSGLYLESVKVDGSSITGQLIGNVTGHVTGTVSSLSNLDTNNLSEGSINKYYTAARVRGDVSGGLGINYNESTGVFSLPQEVSNTSNVRFNNVTVDGTLNSDDITGTNVSVSNNLTVAGNLTVNGTQTIVNSTVVEIGDNKIVLNAGGLSSNDAGIIANVNNSQYEFYFKTDDTAWYANEAIQSGTGFIGDVTGNVSGVLTGSMTMTGHILPDTNAVYDIGSAEYKVRHMYLSNNSLWIGELHKIGVNTTSDQVEIRKRKTDAIPQSFANAGRSQAEILSSAGVPSLSDMTLGKWDQVARNFGIDQNNIFDTSQPDDWETTLDVQTIADDVTTLQTLTTNQGTTLTNVQSTANSALTYGITNSGSISSLETLTTNQGTTLTNVQSTANSALTYGITNSGSISSLETLTTNQGTTLTNVQSTANSAFTSANSALTYGITNSDSITSLETLTTNQGTTLTNVQSTANSAFTSANSALTYGITNSDSITSLQTLTTNQGTTLTNVQSTANSAFTSANTALTYGITNTGSISSLETLTTNQGTTLTNVQSTATSAFTNANTALTYGITNTGSISSLETLTTNQGTTLTNVQSTATSAFTSANSALTYGITNSDSITSLETLTTNQGTTLTNVQSTANSAFTSANSALTYGITNSDSITSLQTLTTNQGTTLTNVQSTANSALTYGITNTGDITNLESSLLTTEGDVSTIQSSITTLQASVGSKHDTISPTTDLTMNNLTLSGYLRGPTNMIIDPATHGDDTGTLTVKGSLQVLGTTTTINSETLTINDNSIILNNNYSGSSPSENASIEIERGGINNASIMWNENIDQWEFYKEGATLSNIKCNTIRVDNDNTLGNISASFSGSTLTITGDANISYGVCTATGNPGTLSALSVSYIEKNTQILIYYTNNSGGDINIGNVLTINDGACKTNLSEQLTITNNSSALFCIVRVSNVYILTVSQLY